MEQTEKVEQTWGLGICPELCRSEGFVPFVPLLRGFVPPCAELKTIAVQGFSGLLEQMEQMEQGYIKIVK